MNVSDQEYFNACRQWQAHYTEALRDVGGRVPEPIYGQHPNDYRRECCRTFKRTFLPQNRELSRVNYRGLSSDALPVFEQQLLPACVQHATNPVRNPYTDRVDAIQFIGHWNPASQSEDCFTKDPAYGHRPACRAVIRTPDTHPGWFPKEIPSVWIKGRIQTAA